MDEKDDTLNYDLRAIAKQEKQAAKKVKRDKKFGKNKTGSQGSKEVEEGVNKDFKIDLQDSRFTQLFEGNSKYGIDMTSAEYRETQGIKDILSEQQRNRKTKGAKSADSSSKEAKTEAVPAAVTAGDEVNSLANKLKRKFGGK